MATCWVTCTELAGMLRLTYPGAWAWARRASERRGFPKRRTFVTTGGAKVSAWPSADVYQWFRRNAANVRRASTGPADEKSVGARDLTDLHLLTLAAPGPSPSYLAEVRDQLRDALLRGLVPAGLRSDVVAVLSQ